MLGVVNKTTVYSSKLSVGHKSKETEFSYRSLSEKDLKS